MVNINNKAKVISLPDESGTDVFATHLRQLKTYATTSHSEKVKLAFLVKAVNLMQKVDFSDLPTTSDRFFETVTVDVDGIPYTQRFELIKPLRKANIYELRLNMRRFNWRFRATFFPELYNGVQFHCFVFPFEKFIGLPDPTDHYRDRTFNIYHDVHNNPNNYTNYFK